MSQQTQNTIDQNKIQEFMNKAIGDIAGSSTAMLSNYWRKTWPV